MGIKENPFLANITGSKTRFEGLNRFKFSSRHSISSQVPTIMSLCKFEFLELKRILSHCLGLFCAFGFVLPFFFSYCQKL